MTDPGVWKFAVQDIEICLKIKKFLNFQIWYQIRPGLEDAIRVHGTLDISRVYSKGSYSHANWKSIDKWSLSNFL